MTKFKRTFDAKLEVNAIGVWSMIEPAVAQVAARVAWTEVANVEGAGGALLARRVLVRVVELDGHDALTGAAGADLLAVGSGPLDLLALVAAPDETRESGVVVLVEGKRARLALSAIVARRSSLHPVLAADVATRECHESFVVWAEVAG